MPKHIGIIGCSAEGAALCYRTICVEGADYCGAHGHPEVTMHTFPLSAYTPFFGPGDWEGVAALMLASEAKVAAAGADFAVCPDNTIHQAFDFVAANARLPWLHIAVEVAAEANRQGFERLGVLGTRFLMEGPVYPDKLAAQGIAHEIPAPDDRERINKIIFGELVYGRFEAESRADFVEVIERLKSRGCDAVVLGCTEIPLLISPADSPLPVLDSTRLLARAALREATHGPMPPADAR
jgi:aspartate racemase